MTEIVTDHRAFGRKQIYKGIVDGDVTIHGTKDRDEDGDITISIRYFSQKGGAGITGRREENLHFPHFHYKNPEKFAKQIADVLIALSEEEFK